MMDERIGGSGRIQMRGMEENTWDSQDAVEMIIRLAVAAVFIWAVVVLVNQLVKYLNSKSLNNNVTPDDIAKMRLAKGEITKAEYDEVKKELK